MRNLSLILFLVVLCGCGPQIIPRQAPGGTVDLKAGSQTLRHDGIIITARVDSLNYAPYRQVDNLTSFYLDVQNLSATPWKFPFNGLMVVASDGRQFTAISPLQVKEMVSRDLPYMVPYPYVGYYYLEDAQRGSYFNSFTSDLPYYAANHPQDIFTQALPEAAVEPGNRISGLVYFVVDLSSMSAFQLKIRPPSAAAPSGAEYIFPFVVEK